MYLYLRISPFISFFSLEHVLISHQTKIHVVAKITISIMHFALHLRLFYGKQHVCATTPFSRLFIAYVSPENIHTFTRIFYLGQRIGLISRNFRNILTKNNNLRVTICHPAVVRKR